MSLDNIRKTIEEHFAAEWNEPLNGGIMWGMTGEEPFDFPKVSLHILPGASINLGLGSGGCTTRTGTVSVMIFVAPHKGLGKAWSIADAVKNIFENKRLSDMRLFETSVYDRGLTEKGKAYVFEATTYYETEEP